MKKLTLLFVIILMLSFLMTPIYGFYMICPYYDDYSDYKQYISKHGENVNVKYSEISLLGKFESYRGISCLDKYELSSKSKAAPLFNFGVDYGLFSDDERNESSDAVNEKIIDSSIVNISDMRKISHTEDTAVYYCNDNIKYRYDNGTLVSISWVKDNREYSVGFNELDTECKLNEKVLIDQMFNANTIQNVIDALPHEAREDYNLLPIIIISASVAGVLILGVSVWVLKKRQKTNI